MIFLKWEIVYILIIKIYNWVCKTKSKLWSNKVLGIDDISLTDEILKKKFMLIEMK